MAPNSLAELDHGAVHVGDGGGQHVVGQQAVEIEDALEGGLLDSA